MTEQLYKLITDTSKTLEEFIKDAYEVVRVSSNIELVFNNKISVQAAIYSYYLKNVIYINPGLIKECLIKKGVIAAPIYEEFLSDDDKLLQDIIIKMHTISILIHENEHVKQLLIRLNVLSSGYDFYDQVCKDLKCYDTNPILNMYYNRFKHDDMFFERNANLFASKQCLELAKMLDIDELIQTYQDFVDIYTLQGYVKKDKYNVVLSTRTDGSIKDSYKIALRNGLYKRLIIPGSLTTDEKIELGLELSESEVKQLFDKISSNNPSNHIVRFRK